MIARTFTCVISWNSIATWNRISRPARPSRLLEAFPTKMTRVRPSRASAAIAAALIAACSAPQARNPDDPAADRALAEQVRAALHADPNLYAEHVDIDVKRGVVRLSGFVYTAREERLALQDSAAVPGAQRVVDGLEVYDYVPVH